jgi:hypothetical protein
VAKIETEEWDRQPFESMRAYSYFCLYRDTDQLERSVKKVAEKVGRSVRMMWDLSSKWDWLNRAEAYDLHMQRLKLAAQEKARIEMAERQAREGTTLQNIAMGGVKNLLDQTGQVRKDVEITPSVIARLLEVGVKIERLARGEPTDNVAADHTGEVKVVRLPTPAEDDDEWAKRSQEEYERRRNQRSNDLGAAAGASDLAR